MASQNQHPPFSLPVPSSLAEVIAEYRVWVDYNFGASTPLEQFLGVVEEVGELAHSLLKDTQGIRGTHDEHYLAQRDAVADILIFLIGFCYRRGWDLEQVLLDAWIDVRARDWIQFPNDGRTE